MQCKNKSFFLKYSGLLRPFHESLYEQYKNICIKILGSPHDSTNHKLQPQYHQNSTTTHFNIKWTHVPFPVSFYINWRITHLLSHSVCDLSGTSSDSMNELWVYTHIYNHVGNFVIHKCLLLISQGHTIIVFQSISILLFCAVLSFFICFSISTHIHIFCTYSSFYSSFI